jgi:hypothetical protein
MWILSALAAIPKILSGAGGIASSISDVVNKRTELEAKKVEAKNNVERAKIEQEIAAVDARKDVLIAEAQAGIRNNSVIRNFMGFSIAIAVFKVFVLYFLIAPIAGCVGDMSGAGCYIFSIPSLPPEWAVLVGIATTFYFLGKK